MRWHLHSLYGYPIITSLHYMAILPSPTWDLLWHDIARGSGTPLFIGLHGSYDVAMCPPSTLFYISRAFAIFILSYKYLFLILHFTIKCDNYYLYLLSTFLEPSYLGMILSSCITKLVSCDFHNLLQCFKYALHISTDAPSILQAVCIFFFRHSLNWVVRCEGIDFLVFV